MSLEAVIRQRLRSAEADRGIGRAPRGAPMPLSVGQQQMWLLHEFDPASPAYLMTWTVRLSGPLDIEGLRLAWERVVHRHEILRTRYVVHDDEPAQVIDPPERFDLRVIDITGGSERRAGQLAAWERGRPIDLHTQPPVQVSLITVDAQLHLMVVTIHHIACDDVSFRRIATEVSAAYAEHVTGAADPRTDVDLHYADFAAWELAGHDDGRLDAQLDHWRRTLDGVAELALPLDRPRPAQQDWRGGSVEFGIAPETARRVHALASAHHASPYMVLLAVYHAVLAHLAACDDVAVGMPVSARTRPELDDVVGYLVNTVVVRSRQADGTFTGLLRDVRDRVLDAMDHRAVPFKWVVDAVRPARTSAANPLFQAAFDMEHAEESPFRLPGLAVEQLALPAPPATKFDLTLHVEANDDERLGVRFEYAAAVLDEQTVRAWARHWLAVLDAVVRDPDAPLRQVHARVAAPELRTAANAVPAPQERETAELVHSGLIDRIQRIWCDVLAREVALSDNFFDVGGDSLIAVALAGRLKADGLAVSATDIFANQTVEELARACADTEPSARARAAATEPFALLAPADRAKLPPGVTDAYPLAAMQLGMLIELRARPDLNTYQDTTSYLIRDDARFDAAALQEAAQLVVDRHEVLRTGFDLNSYSVPLQLVHERAAITVGVANHGNVGPDGWLPRLREYAAKERRTPMDLARPPLIRVFAHTADDTNQWWITITECHPILEGWSFHTMLMEILTGYRAIRAGHHPTPPELPAVRYADYVAAEAASRESEADSAYWGSVVRGRADAALPSAWREHRSVPRERYQHLVLFRDLEADLRRLASQTRTSMKAVLLAAHMTVMGAVTGLDEFFTGLVCDARPEVAGAERVLGMYLNTVPFAMPRGERTWGELVRTTYDALTELWPHRVFPLQELQQEFTHRGRLLEVFFNYLDFHQVDDALVDGDHTLNDNDNEFALHVFTMPGLLKFNTTNHCLSRAAAEQLATLYRTVLEQLALGPDGEVGTTRPAGRPRVTGAEPETVPAAFARIAGEQPEAPAVRHEGTSLSYGELHSRAVEVADRLRRTGFGPGHALAPAQRRDPDAVVELLGAWLAGAAVGTTRTPGVARDIAWADPAGTVSHRALAHAMANRPDEPGAVWLCATPWPSAAAVTEVLAALLSGGVAVLADEVPDTIPAGITHVRLTSHQAQRVRIPDGVTVVVSADPLVRNEIRGAHHVVEVDGMPGWVALDGVAAPGLDVQVTGTALRPVPAGVVGELCVNGGRRTGLLARSAADGSLEVVGRTTERTIRGEQPVDLQRTRELLDAHPAVRDSVVLLRTTRGRERLVGYVRTVPGAPFAEEEVRRSLAEQRLARPVVPDVLVAVESWPSTAHGMVDRDRLPEPPDTADAPEERLWDEEFDALLRRTFGTAGPLAPDTPLADAGLDSFGTVGLLVAIEQTYGITIPDDFQIFDMFRSARALWETVAALRDAR